MLTQINEGFACLKLNFYDLSCWLCCLHVIAVSKKQTKIITVLSLGGTLLMLNSLSEDKIVFKILKYLLLEC